MRTLGIDLAAQPKKTAWCLIEWLGEHAVVEPPSAGASNDELLDLMANADWVGIDAPFGWPDAMVRAIHGYANGKGWPEVDHARLRYRATDQFVHDLLDARGVSVWPLSVSSDRIAVCAWRCAALLTEHASRGHTFDRLGRPPAASVVEAAQAPGPPASGPAVVEVYPAAALAMWGVPHKGYKQNAGLPAQQARRKRLTAVAALRDLADGRLEVAPAVEAACALNDDLFDAFISSLVARAAAIGRTVMPDEHQSPHARSEGWIHVPREASLPLLATG